MNIYLTAKSRKNRTYELHQMELEYEDHGRYRLTVRPQGRQDCTPGRLAVRMEGTLFPSEIENLDDGTKLSLWNNEITAMFLPQPKIEEILARADKITIQAKPLDRADAEDTLEPAELTAVMGDRLIPRSGIPVTVMEEGLGMGKKKEKQVWVCAYGGMKIAPARGVRTGGNRVKLEDGRMLPLDGLKHIQVRETEAECTAAYNAMIEEHIQKCQAQIRELNGALIPTLQADMDEDGNLALPPVWRADLSFDYGAIFGAMENNLVPKEGCDGDHMEWGAFAKDVKGGMLTDNDGFGDLLIDGVASSNAALYLWEQCLYIGDTYRVPFARVPEVFHGHKVGVLWFNK